MQQSLQLKNILCAAFSFAFASGAFAQTLSETYGIRFYEHHSSDMTNMPIGSGANGSRSGYDFVQRRYFNSFNETSMGAYVNGEEANLDMVEHNGPFGTNGASMYLGFTSGVSTIWGGPIKGNGTTRWMKAPAGFDYASITSVSDISAAYNDASASVSVAEVKNNEIYIGRIRGGNAYVALKCSNVHIPSGPPTGTNNDNIYFDFDYKAAALATGIAEAESNVLSVYPNPAEHTVLVSLHNNQQVQSVKIYAVSGKEVLQPAFSGAQGQIDISSLPVGLYVLNITTTDGSRLVKRIIKSAGL